MKKLALLVAVAGAFTLTPWIDRWGALTGALLLVGMGVAVAFAASGTLSAVAAAAGAVGALASGLVRSSSAALAGAVLVALCYSERTARVRSGPARVVHVAMAAVSGAVGGALAARYALAEPWLRATVAVVSAVAVALPLLIEAEDPLAHALEALGRQVSEPSKSALEAGAALRRSADESVLEGAAARDVRRTWRNLLRLAEARARLERAGEPLLHGGAEQHAAVVRRLDERIGAHVAALGRALCAADEARAAEASVDDRALRSVESAVESLEQVSKALLDDQPLAALANEPAPAAAPPPTAVPAPAASLCAPLAACTTKAEGCTDAAASGEPRAVAAGRVA
jgi:hypothetical protein